MEHVDPWWLPERIEWALAQTTQILFNVHRRKGEPFRDIARFVRGREIERALRRILEAEEIMRDESVAAAKGDAMRDQFRRLTIELGGKVITAAGS